MCVCQQSSMPRLQHSGIAASKSPLQSVVGMTRPVTNTVVWWTIPQREQSSFPTSYNSSNNTTLMALIWTGNILSAGRYIKNYLHSLILFYWWLILLLFLLLIFIIINIYFVPQVDCNKGPASDKTAFSSWVRELSIAFKPHGLLLSTAVSPSKKVIDAGRKLFHISFIIFFTHSHLCILCVLFSLDHITFC